MNAVKYQIEDGVPLPNPEQKGPSKYPFRRMKIGQSFFAKLADYAKLRCAAYYYKQKHGMRFSVRLQDKGVRVWRTK